MLLFVVGLPVLLGVHFKFFPNSTEPKVIATFASLDELPVLFDPVTQEPQARYCGDPEVEIEFVGKDVEFSPTTGERCWPLTPAVVKMLRGAEASRLEENAERKRAAEDEAARQVEKAERLEAERRQQAERGAAQRAEADFRARYVNGSALEQLRAGHVTVAVSSAGLERRIASALRERGASVSTNVFTDQIFSPDVFGRLANRDGSLLLRLQLADRSGTLLLGQFKRGTLRPTGVGNTVSLSGALSISLVPLSDGTPSTLPRLTDTGAGFDENQALEALEERLVDALMKSEGLHIL